MKIINTVPVYGASPYEKVRELCHAVKDGDLSAIKECGKTIALNCKNEDVFGNAELIILIPVPEHNGHATSSLQLAEWIRYEFKNNGIFDNVEVLDLLKCKKHPSLYDLKKEGIDISDFPLRVRFTCRNARRTFNYITCQDALSKLHPDDKYTRTAIFLVDNVVDTGHTIKEVYKRIGMYPVLAVGMP